MSISERLNKIIKLAGQGHCVADIGCDHGYVSISLLQNGSYKKAIAMDVNEGPLQKATINGQKAGVSKKLETRLSNGFEKLLINEADTVVICGMGGPLLIKILDEGKDCASLVKNIILGPQSEISEFRHYLYNNCFHFVEEACIKEDGKFYYLIKGHYEDSKDSIYDGGEEVLFKYGALPLKNKDLCLYEELINDKKKYEQLEKSLNLAKDKNPESENIKSRIIENKKEIELIEQALSYFD